MIIWREVVIETSLDPKKCNILDIHVWGHSDSVSVKCGDEKYGSGNNRLLTKEKQERITLHVDSEYVVEKVILNDVEEKVIGTYGEFNVDFTDKKTQTMVIYTVPKYSTEEKKIVFANKSSNITYQVNTKSPIDPKKTIVKKDPIKQNTYTINSNEPLMEFSVTYKAGYTADVIIPEGVLYDVTFEKNTITYSLALTTLGNAEAPTEIIIEEFSEPKTVSIIYDEAGFSKIETIVNGKYITGKKTDGTAAKPATIEYDCVYGTQILLQVETTDQFVLETIKETNGSTVNKLSPGKQIYSYTINVDGDKTIELGLKGVYTTKVYSEKVSVDAIPSSALKTENKVYTVEAGKPYTLRLFNGTKIREVTKAVLKSGSTVLKDTAEISDSENVFFDIPANQSGKTLTLEVSCKEGTKEYTHKVQLKVLPTAKITKINGVSNGKVSQTADTVNEYTFTCNQPLDSVDLYAKVETAEEGADVRPDKDKLDREAQEWFQAEIEGHKLIITVKTTEINKKALIKIYDKNKEPDLEVGTFTITSKAPSFVTATPTVSQKSATNLELILSLGMKGLGEIQQGKYWYKVEGTPKYPEKPAEELINNTGSFVEYIEYTSSTQVETIRVVDRDRIEMPGEEVQQSEGEGQQQEGNQRLTEGKFPYKADYNIKVTLVKTKEAKTKEEIYDDSDVVFTSKTTKTVAMSTKVPSYETNLNIKTVKATLYSGQKNVIAATPVFSKNTSYQKITVESLQEGIEAVADEKGNIIVSVEPNVKPGKYTIEVTAEAAENTLPSKKSFTIEVVQGIYDLTLETPQKLYKGYNKAVSFKTNLIYNQGDSVQPKTKKVEWELETWDTEKSDWVPLVDEQGEEHPYAKFFTIKDGKVTVDKSYIVSNVSAKNKFRVKATARDYVREAGQEDVIGYSEFEITNEKLTLGELVLVKKTDSQSEVWEVMARSGSKVSVDKVSGSRIAILKKGTPERDKYTEVDFDNVEEGLLNYSSSNKALIITQEGNYRTVETKGIASKVQLTVTTTDGSNVKTSLNNLTITYGESGNLGLIVIQGDNNKITVMDSFVAGTKQFYGSKDTKLRVKIQEQNEKGYGQEVYGANYTLKVQGAKIIESNQLEGEHVLVGTADTIVLQLTNNTRKVTKKFTLVNASLANNEVKKSKALTLKAEGTLKTGEKLTKEQKITYTLPKTSIGKYTHAYVTVDTLDSLDKKKEANYTNLIDVSKGSIGNVQRISSDGKITLTFGAEQEGGEYCIPEQNFTYKLNIAVGTVTDNYDFKAEVKPNAVTIKTTVGKILDAKLNTTYNMSIKEGGEVILTLNNKKTSLVSMGIKGKETTPGSGETEGEEILNVLMNRNIGGKENKFAEFFEVVKVVRGEGEQQEVSFKLRLKPGTDPKDIGTNDWKGYINQYTYTDGTKEKTIYNTAIEIKSKDLIQKYSLTKAVVLIEKAKIGTFASINTQVNLMAGSQVVDAKYVYVPLVKASNKWKEQMFNAAVNENGALELSSKKKISVFKGNFEKEKDQEVKIASSNTCTLYVIPEGSFYEKMVKELWEDIPAPPEEGAGDEVTEAYKTSKEKYEKAMEAYGIKLTATVEVKAQETTTGKIKFTNTKPKYTEEHFLPVLSNGKTEVNFIVDEENLGTVKASDYPGEYVVTIPYTKVADCNVTWFKNVSTNTLVKVKETQNPNAITLTLNKKDLRESNKYGKSVTVKAVVEFDQGIEETVSFSVTLPAKPVQAKAVKDSLSKVAWSDLDVVYREKKEENWIYLDAEKLVSENKHLIEDEIKAMLAVDGDVVANIVGTAKVPSQLEEGFIKYTISLWNLTADKSVFGDGLMVTIPLDRELTPPSELANELNSAIAHWSDSNRTVLTNLDNPNDVISNIRRRVLTRNGDTIYKHLRLYADITEYRLATEGEAGIITGTIRIVNIADPDVNPLEVDFKFDIPKLFTSEEAEQAVKDEVVKIVVYNTDLSNTSKKKEKINQILKAAKKALKGQDYFVEVKRDSDLKGTLANGETPGKATLKLNLIQLTTSRISTEISCEFTVKQQ